MTISLVSAAKILRTKVYNPNGSWGKKLTQAAERKAIIDKLEAEQKAFREEIVSQMEKLNIDRLECGQIRVNKVTRANWMYSNKLSLEMQRVKADQKWEQSKGIASNEPKISCALTIVCD